MYNAYEPSFCHTGTRIRFHVRLKLVDKVERLIEDNLKELLRDISSVGKLLIIEILC